MQKTRRQSSVKPEEIQNAECKHGDRILFNKFQKYRAGLFFLMLWSQLRKAPGVIYFSSLHATAGGLRFFQAFQKDWRNLFFSGSAALWRSTSVLTC